MYDRILVPTDGSQSSKNAARNAIELAEDLGASIHVLYAMDMGDAAFVAVPSDIEETRERLETKGRRFTRELREMVDEAGIDCVADVRSGIAPEVIVDYAEEHGIDLIVMGKRGRGDPDKPAIGSITHRVIGSTDATVLTT